MGIARLLVRDAALHDLRKVDAAQLATSPHIVRDEGTQRIDEEASMAALLGARNSGDLPPVEFDYQVFRMTNDVKQEQVPNE
jgi:hypothetical protein